MRTFAVLFLCAAAVAADPLDAFVLTGFDNARAGSSFGFENGTEFSAARLSLSTNFPNATTSSVNTLSAASLAGSDVLLLSAGGLVAPLSAAEQAALFDFVGAGGGVILLLENSAWDLAAESLIDPFGMDSDGNLPGTTTATVSGVHPVTTGVASFTQAGPGRISGLGPYAASHATNGIGVALGIIDPGVISAGSGSVIIFSDTNQFLNAFFAGNQLLFLNSIDYAIPGAGGPTDPGPVPEPGTITLIGAAVAGYGFRRRRRRTT